jgi:uncharacterized protein with GYD domain
MPLYMTHFSYTSEAWAALATRPQDRGETFDALVQSQGGRLVGLYYHFGDYDGTAIFDAPDDLTASATIVSAVVPGHIRATKTTRLFSRDEVLEVMRRAGTAAYEAPSESREVANHW